MEIIFLLIIFFAAYKLVVLVGKAIINSDFRKNILTGDINKDSSKFSFKITTNRLKVKNTKSSSKGLDFVDMVSVLKK